MLDLVRILSKNPNNFIVLSIVNNPEANRILAKYTLQILLAFLQPSYIIPKHNLTICVMIETLHTRSYFYTESLSQFQCFKLYLEQLLRHLTLDKKKDIQLPICRMSSFSISTHHATLVIMFQ